MKEFIVEKTKEGSYICKDCDMIIYRGVCKKDGNQYTLSIYNAYEDEILSIAYKSGGFRLFRSSKPSVREIAYQGYHGTLTMKDQSYQWLVNHVRYQFFCADKRDHVNVIMKDKGEVLGYVKDGQCICRHALYSVELCAVWMLMQEEMRQKDQLYIEETSFSTMIQEASF